MLQHFNLFDGFPAREVNHQHPVPRGKILQSGEEKSQRKIRQKLHYLHPNPCLDAFPMVRLHSRLFPWGTAAPQRWAPGSPVQQSVVQVFTEPLQDLVMVSDGRCLIFTGSKVALQLQREGMRWLEWPSPVHEEQVEVPKCSYPALNSFLCPLSFLNPVAGFTYGV